MRLCEADIVVVQDLWRDQPATTDAARPCRIFPHCARKRLEDIVVLKNALDVGEVKVGEYARYEEVSELIIVSDIGSAEPTPATLGVGANFKGTPGNII